MILEYGEAAIAIDCGLMFPEVHMLGIDLVIPDFTYLYGLGDRFLGFVMTHGHEDHIGALPFFLRDMKVPVYAPPMAAGLLAEKLKEHGLYDSTQLNVVRPNDQWEMGPFRIQPIHMTHSTVDATALAIRTPVGTVIHTGDFKLDYTPMDGKGPDLNTLAEFAAEGVLLLLSDSTNAEHEGYTASERSVRGGLERSFADASGKVFFSTFSSHVHRVQQVLDVSQRYGRRVGVIGRSLLSSIKLATHLGYLEYPPSLFADNAELPTLAPERQTLLTTGSQGEPMSALIRISEDAHGQVKMNPGDTVILSSRIIPGNEKSISNMIDHMYRRGASVHHGGNCAVHVSGHASREELKLILRLVRPKYFVPVHGEYRHLVAHRELAQMTGLPAENTFLLEDGHTLEIDDSEARIAPSVRAGRVFVDGKGVGDIEDLVLRDRRHLSSDGFVLVVLAIAQHSGELISGPDFVSRGFVPEESGQEYLESAKTVVLDTVQQIATESLRDSMVVKEEVRKALKRYFSKTLDRRPVIIPFIMEM